MDEEILRGLDDGAAVETLGCISVVPFDLVGDERCAATATASRQAAALRCKLIGYVRSTPSHLVERQARLLKHLRGLPLQLIGLGIVAFLTQRVGRPGENAGDALGTATTDEQAQRLPDPLQRPLHIIGGETSTRSLEGQVGGPDRHAALLGLLRHSLKYIGGLGEPSICQQTIGA